MAGFINAEFFKQEAERQRLIFDVSNWIDLVEGEIFLIEKIQKLESKQYGACYLLHIIDRDGNKRKVWGPARLIIHIQENRKAHQNVFFCSLGVQPGDKKRQENSRNLFEAVFDDTDHPVQLFYENGENEVSTEKNVQKTK